MNLVSRETISSAHSRRARPEWRSSERRSLICSCVDGYMMGSFATCGSGRNAGRTCRHRSSLNEHLNGVHCLSEHN